MKRMAATLRQNANDPEDIRRAAALLRAGELVAFPTETVYGLGANALDAAAVAGIFAAKERPAWDPLICHVAAAGQLTQLAHVEGTLAARVQTLGEDFWPGPLTLLLPRTSAVPEAVTAGRGMVGVRVPAHPAAQALLQAFGGPVAAPSANRFGHTSPTTAEHVLADLDGRIAAVLDGGPCAVGVESTVLDPATMIIYRPGAVTAEHLEAATGVAPQLYAAPERGAAPESLPSPGVGIRHYAPRARVLLTAARPEAVLAAAETLEGSMGLLLPHGWLRPSRGQIEVFDWGPWTSPHVLAARLFAGLRALDKAEVAVIIAPLPDGPGGLWDALRDRLSKAAKPTS
jgi:L-threonylcarbamoyladenylate synthase